jgi:hypothetical protein
MVRVDRILVGEFFDPPGAALDDLADSLEVPYSFVWERADSLVRVHGQRWVYISTGILTGRAASLIRNEFTSRMSTLVDRGMNTR